MHSGRAAALALERVLGTEGLGFPQPAHFMAKLAQDVTEFVGNIVINEELQAGASAICRVTSKSISPRWSS